MNQNRRKRINDIRDKISELRDELDTIREEEDEYRENIPEQFQGNLHYEQSEEASSNMEEAVESHDQVLDCLEDATQQ